MNATKTLHFLLVLCCSIVLSHLLTESPVVTSLLQVTCLQPVTIRPCDLIYQFCNFEHFVSEKKLEKNKRTCIWWRLPFHFSPPSLFSLTCLQTYIYVWFVRAIVCACMCTYAIPHVYVFNFFDCELSTTTTTTTTITISQLGIFSLPCSLPLPSPPLTSPHSSVHRRVKWITLVQHRPPSKGMCPLTHLPSLTLTSPHCLYVCMSVCMAKLLPTCVYLFISCLCVCLLVYLPVTLVN